VRFLDTEAKPKLARQRWPSATTCSPRVPWSRRGGSRACPRRA
jgi:hypothetical protein